MPILDYDKRAELQREKTLENPRISPANRAHLLRFLDSYNVSSARLAIFLKHIEFLLENTEDIAREMNDRSFINRLFRQFNDRMTHSYYNTIVNVSLRFVRWLNDDVKPSGFKDIKNGGKKEGKRGLDPEDMLTWEDGLMMSKTSADIQMSAIIMTQLDAGLRPSEFIDLNYGDISIQKPCGVIKVRHGKTGSRDVVLFRSVPFLQRWLLEHPTKRRDDPLWIMKYHYKSHLKGGRKPDMRYAYPAVLKRVKELGGTCQIKKPLDFYNFRHSAVTLSKKENMNPDLAAEKFGHSIEFYMNTYGRLDLKDKIHRFAQHYGAEEEVEKKIELNRECHTCHFTNEPGDDICRQCGAPLTFEAATKIRTQKEIQISEMADRLKYMEEQMLKLDKVEKLFSLVEQQNTKVQRGGPDEKGTEGRADLLL